MTCEHCPESRRNRHFYCSRCGEPLFMKKSDPVFSCGLLIVLGCLVLLLIGAAVAFLKFGYVFENLQNDTESLIIILPFPISIAKLSGAVLQTYYVLLLVAMVLSVGYTIYTAIKPVSAFMKDKDPARIKNTALYELSVLFAAVTFIQLAFAFLLVAGGMEITDPFDGVDEWWLIFSLLEASVWEEIIARLLLIGVPMLVLCTALKYGEEKKWWNYLLGGFGINRLAFILIVLSSMMFGIAHIPGWDLWKAFPTFLAGLVMGYLFSKYGIHAAITLHFLTDYLSSLGWLVDYGEVFSSLLLMGIALLGIVFVAVYGKRCLDYVKALLNSDIP